jgi:hypothetical protein
MNVEYKAFLIRLRRHSDQSSWRVTLENVHSGERLQFANEKEMLRYLLQVFSSQQSDEDTTSPGGLMG